MVAEKLADLGYGTMFLGCLLTGLGWAILGLSFWAVLRGLGAVGGNPFEQLHLYIAAVTLATVAGFVSFVPGGAVVREAVLTELTAPYLGDVVALVSAVLLRLVSLHHEGLLVQGTQLAHLGLGLLLDIGPTFLQLGQLGGACLEVGLPQPELLVAPVQLFLTVVQRGIAAGRLGRPFRLVVGQLLLGVGQRRLRRLELGDP